MAMAVRRQLADWSAGFGTGLSRAAGQSTSATHGFDMQSAWLNAITFGFLIFAINGFGHEANRWLISAMLVIAIGVGYFFVKRQLTLTSPLLPVDLLRIPMFALSVGTSVCSFCAQMLGMVSLPFYLQETLGRSATETGLLLTPWPLAIVVIAPLAGRLVEKKYPPAHSVASAWPCWRWDCYCWACCRARPVTAISSGAWLCVA